MIGLQQGKPVPLAVLTLLPRAEEARLTVMGLGPAKFDINAFWRVEFERLTQANLRTDVEQFFATYRWNDWAGGFGVEKICQGC